VNVTKLSPNLNKSPGLDGLTNEFYKTFWPNIGNLLVDVFNESFEKNELPISQKQSILSLIFKKNDRNDISNYRPISLSNVDYKICAFVLANRLHKVLDKIISTDQAGFVKRRFIGNNIRMVQDIMDHTKHKNMDGMLIFLDFKKAFDSIEWEFMHKVLKRFNFGKVFIDAVKTIYNGPELFIKIMVSYRKVLIRIEE
jgi:hypothetical protein